MKYNYMDTARLLKPIFKNTNEFTVYYIKELLRDVQLYKSVHTRYENYKTLEDTIQFLEFLIAGELHGSYKYNCLFQYQVKAIYKILKKKKNTERFIVNKCLNATSFIKYINDKNECNFSYTAGKKVRELLDKDIKFAEQKARQEAFQKANIEKRKERGSQIMASLRNNSFV